MSIFALRRVLPGVRLRTSQTNVWQVGLYAFLAVPQILCAQDSLFVVRSGGHLSLGGQPFYAIGVNSYFLQNLAAAGDTNHLAGLLQTDKDLGVTAVRTWGFFDSSDSTNLAVMQFAPGRLNESGLRALDYVIAEAKAFSIRLIIPLVNNWEDYGGMNQYVQWYAQLHPSVIKTSLSVTPNVMTGTNGRSYRFQVSGSLTHDDFYRNPEIKQWYKNYIGMILNRINTITHTANKDEPAILVWELANEPRSSDPSGRIVSDWLSEMSLFIKSVDTNHLVSSGEEGLDVSPAAYGSVGSYNGQDWLFNGSAGISYSQNLQISSLDIASIHCYIEPWGLTPDEAIAWLDDHQRLADAAHKPLVVGETGMAGPSNSLYEAVFYEAYFDNTAGVLLWQSVFENSPYTDAFAFSCPNDVGICSVLGTYAERFEQKSTGKSSVPPAAFLLQNYPNPFNFTTVISYELPSRDHVQLEVYDILGQRVESLVDNEQEPGYHVTSFDAAPYGSGSYFVRLTVGSIAQTRKILLLK